MAQLVNGLPSMHHFLDPNSDTVKLGPCNPSIPGRQEDREFKVILGYMSSTAAARPCLFVLFFSFVL